MVCNTAARNISGMEFTLRIKIVNPLLAVLISIKVAASQAEHLLDPLHLPEGEEREQQAAWHRAECGFLKVGIVLGNCK